MKLSVSLPDEDIAYLDRVAAEAGGATRSAALQRMIRQVRELELAEAYAAEWDAWSGSPDAELWDGTAGDGLPSGNVLPTAER